MFKLFAVLLVMTAVLLIFGMWTTIAVMCSKSNIDDKTFALKALPVLLVCLVLILVGLWFSGVIVW